VKLATFAIADGTFVHQDRVPGGWFDPQLRFVSAISLTDTAAKWQLFIVGPGDVKATDRCLQVTSWDGTVYRLYGVRIYVKFYVLHLHSTERHD